VPAGNTTGGFRLFLDRIGRATVGGIEEVGYAASMFVESIYWIIYGKKRRQEVKLPAVFSQMMQVGIFAIPITAVLAFTIGVMLAIQGIATLKTFGAESQVVLGIALSVTREFAPLIVAILVAGRSGSALAARIGTMVVSQEIDALRVIGVSPVRYLVAPALTAMMIMVPALTILADVISMSGGAFYCNVKLGIGYEAYFHQTMDVLEVDDIAQGLWKSLSFAIIIALVGFINGFNVTGGAEGVGKATTRSVVESISCIIVVDMIFTYFLNR
jgi:phospholipid/cholesterol/gamma-HCH transport system permease protein